MNFPSGLEPAATPATIVPWPTVSSSEPDCPSSATCTRREPSASVCVTPLSITAIPIPRPVTPAVHGFETASRVGYTVAKDEVETAPAVANVTGASGATSETPGSAASRSSSPARTIAATPPTNPKFFRDLPCAATAWGAPLPSTITCSGSSRFECAANAASAGAILGSPELLA